VRIAPSRDPGKTFEGDKSKNNNNNSFVSEAEKGCTQALDPGPGYQPQSNLRDKLWGQICGQICERNLGINFWDELRD